MIHVFLKYYQPLLKEKYDDFHKRLNDLDHWSALLQGINP